MGMNGALITPDGSGQLPPAAWVPQPGQPGMPAPGQNWQTPFAGAAQRGALPQPQPRMGQDGMMQMGIPPMPQQMQQPAQQQPGFPPPANPFAQAPLGGWPSPLASQQGFPQGHPAIINSQGQPGSQQFQPQAPQQQFQQQQGFTQQLPPGTAPQAPAPQYPQPQYGQPGMPMQQPLQNPWQQQAAPQQPFQNQQIAQPQQALGVFPNDPRIPAELRGQPVEVGLQWYNGMRNVVTQLAAQPRGAAGQPTQPPMQQPGAPASSTTPGQQPQQQLNATEFFRNPQAVLAPIVGQTVQEVINQQLMPVLAPMAMQSNMSAIQSARQMAAMTIPGFAQLEPGIMQMLASADPRMLTNVETWRMAAGRVMLDQMASGQFRPAAPAAQQPGQPSAWPPQAVAPGQNPLPNLNSFFTETPGQVGAPQQQQGQLTPMQQFVAQHMGMSPEQYQAWQGGTARR